MKKNAIYALAAFVAICAGVSCAKVEKSATYDSAKRYLEAWVHVHYPGLEANEDGLYVIDDIPGDGAEVADSDYLFVDYTIKSIDGTITSTNDPDIARQLGSYVPSNYYGQRVWNMAQGSQYAGLELSLKGMREGGSRTVLIPRWLITTSRFDTLEEYMNDSKGASVDYIYTFTVHDALDSLDRWQIDSMDKYIAKTYGRDKVSESSRGFRYIQLTEPKDTNAFPKDTSIYINYTGRLLNGQVFDTTIADTAKVHRIYSASKTYSPVQVTWGSQFTDIKLSGSSTIAGFAMTLWQMRRYEKGVGVFYSTYGYSTSGSGGAIPEYAPLSFEIEIVDKPEDE